ncbi:hypothetical protein EDM76_11950 [bacterium]|nr:MAG: hypothetical protein EDM76_11950 [bacterium]MCL4230519.1 hypothetical protein [Dehalococcoidia bacterium]
MGASIHLLTSNTALQKALASRLERSQPPALPGDGVEPSVPADIVVTTASECEPERCERLTARGARVIVLAAIPRDTERERYLRAGAVAYVPMDVDTGKLLAEIRRLAPRIDRVVADAPGCNVHTAGAAGLGK